MLLLGLDIGTSSIKATVIRPEDQSVMASVQFPDTEVPIDAPQPGWAEQSPDTWWEHTCQAIHRLGQQGVPLDQVGAVGISYQMHGLVALDAGQQVLRASIIWCDSRAVSIGNRAFDAIGHEHSLQHLLNSPGNFTAAKLAWVKEHEPEIYKQIDKIMLPGDYIALKLTGALTTSPSALSEGVFWDFRENGLSEDVFSHFGFIREFIPPVQEVFSRHGEITEDVAGSLGLKAGTPVTYKAGDQPNNALSLNVLQPGEVAATAGTSGVIYAVTDTLLYDQQSRVNTFAHVNYLEDQQRLGVLLCINGTGILNRWVRETYARELAYEEMNQLAAGIAPGSEGVTVLPFGNGAERMLGNRLTGAQILYLDLNRHSRAHIFRAAQEGIAFAFRYGLDILRENGIRPSVIRAGHANMFLSPVFRETFVNITGVLVELYDHDGSAGAAIGAGIGAGIFENTSDAFRQFQPRQVIEPDADTSACEEAYTRWKQALDHALKNL